MKILAGVAVTGLVLSAIAHALTFFGVPADDLFPGVWLLHIGIFVVWFPSIFVLANWMLFYWIAALALSSKARQSDSGLAPDTISQPS